MAGTAFQYLEQQQQRLSTYRARRLAARSFRLLSVPSDVRIHAGRLFNASGSGESGRGAWPGTDMAGRRVGGAPQA